MTETIEILIGLNQNIEILRDRARRFEDDADPFVRGCAATHVYRDLPDLPVVLKRAEIIARVLETVKPVVLPEERILGAVYRRRRVHEGISDLDAWRVRVAFPEQHGYDERWPLPEPVRHELEWWANRETGRRGANTLRKENGWLGKICYCKPPRQSGWTHAARSRDFAKRGRKRTASANCRPNWAWYNRHTIRPVKSNGSMP